jgi:ferrous iron transport protein B
MKRQLLHWNKETGQIPTIQKTLRVVLVGNPNSGKSSLFNHLTGLNQKIGNFPGVTVDKKSGFCKIIDGLSAEIIDLPGTYSIYPRSLDERVVFDIFSGPDSKDYPDLAVVTVDLSNLKRNLLLFTQVKDLGIPVVLALNMADVAEKAGLKINLDTLKEEFNSPVVVINAREGTGLKDLKEAIADISATTPSVGLKPFYDVYHLVPEVIDAVKAKFPKVNDYQAYQLAQQYLYNSHLSRKDKEFINNIRQNYGFDDKKLQSKETIHRYHLITEAVAKATEKEIAPIRDQFTHKVDKILTHKYWGYVLFLGIMFFVFQAIFAWALVPMEFIDYMFSELSAFLSITLPNGPLNDLLTQGVIPGVGGIMIFIPQIAILFVFISILEESGYMSRVVFLMDKIMRKVGLTGKSVVPLISGVACAIPAIMSTRGIDNWKDRIITILVTPLMSCSARIPVYTILIALVVPNEMLWGFINLQGLALLGMYLLGFVAVIFSAFIIKLIIRQKEKSYFVMELPDYRVPRWKNVGITIVDRVKAFVFVAGKIIIAISIILWVLASYGPGDRMERAEEVVSLETANQQISQAEFNNLVQSYKLEHSYAGIFGKSIEPLIEPLGYDWKIGIALITSFAAREVFVGTMATIYSVGADVEDDSTIISRMKSEINPHTGGPRYTPAMAFSLLVFYAFAMQCMSTLAVVYRETKSWRWPVFQLLYLSTLAYLSAYLVYNIMK